MTNLDQVLWRARRGAGAVVALRGEPGVGKSALIEATVARAMDFEVVQLRGAALAERSAVPKEWPQPVVELLGRRALPVQGSGSGQPGGDAGGRLGSDELRELAAAADEAVRSLIASVRGPLLLTVDDCHLLPRWFPIALGEAATSLLDQAPLAMVLAWRDTPHLPAFDLTPAARISISEHRLGGLTVPQAGTLLARRYENRPAAEVLDHLVVATGGNPYALLDVFSRLSPEQREGWRLPPEPLPIGDTLAAAFGARVAALAEDCRQALAAAAAGRVPVSVLRSVLREIGLGIAALRPAQEAGIIAIRGERLDFVHPLVRAAAFHLVPRGLRSQIHEAIARAYSAGGNVERSAFHASQNATSRDDSLSRLYGHSAHIALDRGDSEAAARHEEMAAELAETDNDAARHLARAGAVWLTVGALERAEVCIGRALALRPSDAVRAEAIYQTARAVMAGDVGPAVAGELLAAAELSEGDNPHRAVLMLLDAVACKLLDGSFDGTVELAERALALARAVSGHAETLARAILDALQAHRSASDGRATAGLGATEVLVSQVQRFSASPALAYVLGAALVHEDRTDEATRWAQWLERCAEDVGDRALAAVPPLVRSMIAMSRGRIADAVGSASSAVERAEQVGHKVLAARALAILVEAYAAEGSYELGFEAAARVFAMPGEIGREPRIQTVSMLAILELQRGRRSSAVAWMRAAQDDFLLGSGATRGLPAPASFDGLHAVRAAECLLLARHRTEVARLAELVPEPSPAAGAPGAWAEWLGCIAEDDLDRAAEHLAAARRALRRAPLLRTRVELSGALRLVEAGRHGEARQSLVDIIDSFNDLDAGGWARIAERELEQLPVDPLADLDAGQGPSSRAALPAGSAPFPAPVAALGPGGESGEPTTRPWELTMLGSFAVHHEGQPVVLPVSLAAQGLKIVALRQRIPVDELVELLWPEAAPGVGTRRLRNVLWRVRAACGDLLLRDANFISLAPGTWTDVAEFQSLAELALDPELDPDEAVRVARQALNLYRGELLPGDRYADWAAAFRESLSRLQIRLLDLLLIEATREERIPEALGLLERLIEADPYEEHHYLQAAEMQARSGNRRRALSTLNRAERTLSDLGVAPSRTFLQVRDTLSK